MPDLTGDHILKISDRDLRELVFRLCLAELRRLGLPESAVTAGGDQNAADGGLDVRVGLEPVAAVQLDFVRAAATGFQAKAQDMTAGDIAEEMRPGGILRPAISSLADRGGAYIIVSSKGSVADAALERRLKAMREAIADEPNAAGLILDFYDRTRLATWVRRYPGVEMWVRDRIGELLNGWRGYGRWSGASNDSPYLHDSAGRILSKTSGTTEPMSAAQGIDAIRDKVRNPGGVVRLIGLSGTGKTRLVQALFEAQVGASAPLDTAAVLYTDLGHAPEPSAHDMVFRVGKAQQRAIVIVDNCNAAAHRTLAQAVAAFGGFVSLLTVEYDVADADDEPEATDVFELAPASGNVLEELVAQRAVHVSQADRHRIAEFAGGNARIALALARTVQRGETLGVLNDSELFRRLFHQKQGTDQGLLCAAEVCSLVYSFEGEDLESAESELRALAPLAGCTVRELYGHISTMMRRDLVQRRSRWRAVLPHALANRLAKDALQNVPRVDLLRWLGASQRLLRSFSRRLSYLHDSPEALAIAERWIDDENWLANPAKLNDLGQAMFFNLAPLVPDKVLVALDRAMAGEGGQSFASAQQYSTSRWLHLCRSLAYEVEHFERAALLVLRFAEAEEGRMSTAGNTWAELFQVALSGVLAPPDRRVAFLRRLSADPSPKRRALVVKAAATMLRTTFISSSHDFSFGARPRGYGWEPRSAEEYLGWFKTAFSLVRDIVTLGGEAGRAVRAAIARELRQLWHDDVLRPELEALVRLLAGSEGWPDGWIAVRSALRFDGAGMPNEVRTRLKALESLLAPQTLRQQIQAYVLSRAHTSLDVADGEDPDDATEDANPVSAWERVDAKARSLGELAGWDDKLLTESAEELLSTPNGRQTAFGVGLGRTTPKPLEHWGVLRDAFIKVGEGERNTSLLTGFLRGLREQRPELASGLLDQIVIDPQLAEVFPYLQGCAWDSVSAARLLRSLEHGRAPTSRFAYCMAYEEGGSLDLDTYCAVVRRLVNAPDGVVAALDLVGMALHGFRTRKQELPRQLVLLGRDILSAFGFDMQGQGLGYRLKELAKVAFDGEDARPSAQAFLERFAVALEDYRTHADSYGDLAGVLFKLQPDAALTILLGRERRRLSPIHMRFGDREGSAVERAAPEAIIAWAAVEPANRLPLVAAEIDILDRQGAGESGLSPLAERLLSLAGHPAPVLEAFAGRFHPSGWSGSLAQTLAPYLGLANKLASSSDPVIATWAAKQIVAMNERIAHDQRLTRRSEESFE